MKGIIVSILVVVFLIRQIRKYKDSIIAKVMEPYRENQLWSNEEEPIDPYSKYVKDQSSKRSSKKTAENKSPKTAQPTPAMSTENPHEKTDCESLSGEDFNALSIEEVRKGIIMSEILKRRF